MSQVLGTPQPCALPGASLSWGCDHHPIGGELLKAESWAAPTPAWGEEEPPGALKVIGEWNRAATGDCYQWRCSPTSLSSLARSGSTRANEMEAGWDMQNSELVHASLPISPKAWQRVVASQPDF